MSAPQTNPFSLTSSLSQEAVPLSDAVHVVGAEARVDLVGAPLGAAAYLLDRAVVRHRGHAVVLVANQAVARRMAADLRFFLAQRPSEEQGLGQVLLYPAADTTPFIEVSTDRRAGMDRLAVLFHLAEKLPWKFLVVPVSAAARRVVPQETIVEGCQRIDLGQKCDRDALIVQLIETGYLRVPLVEDPGTFAVRGSLIDVFPPYLTYPVRIELDEDSVLSLKHFDPEHQRTRAAATHLWVHPVREAPWNDDALRRAKERLSPLCDEVNLPSLKKRQLLDELQNRRLLGIDGVLPAFFEQLGDLFDYLPKGTCRVVVDPTAVLKAFHEELSRAERDRAAKLQDRGPAFALEAHYLSEQAFSDRIFDGPLTVVHNLAVSGQSQNEDEESGPLDALESAPDQGALNLGAEDQSALISELKAQRAAKGAEAPLQPLASRVRVWLREGLHVVLTARTGAQAERLAELLRGYQLDITSRPKRFDPATGARSTRPQVEVVTGELMDGFVLASEAFACVTEHEVFGERARQSQTTEKKRTRARGWLEDLQQLEVGDYVVHVEHGVGRYIGLERKLLPLSRHEQLQGLKPFSVEVLTVEYAGGDKLFVPVTRLNQVSKYAGAEGAKPKLDRLGGQSFARAKSKARSAVRQLADELLVLYAARAARTREPLPPPDRAFAEFEASFPFEETPDQARAIEDVLTDLQSERPMDRLVCGDVGFGKTEVALRAAFRTAMSGRQVALLCPTTVLAQQHYLTFQTRLTDYALRVEVLSRFVSKKHQTEVVAALKRGTCDVVIGTHRLLSKDIYFKNLGLLIVDEEQRFGVAHKERLKKLKTEVDVLTLSATPIPRTLQMAIGGMRELSLIATPPVDRRAVRTFVTRWDPHVIREAVIRELSRGGQIFFVNNRIERLYERARRLAELVPEARIAVAHGQMREASLEKVMTDFVAGRYDMLCSTAIIENGLDIPRANTVLIDGADIFGMAQLYQLRGRVGRASERAYCYLIAPSPSQMTDEARARIAALERFSQLGAGFQLASLDMELRGAGDLLGAEQSGTVAAVGLELFVRMLEEAIAELRGHKVQPAIDPEITLDLEHYLPEEYVSDVGVRLSLYKRFAAAEDEAEVSDLGVELEDRFGPPPEVARQFIRAMALKPPLRQLRVLGCEANHERVRLHFASDAPLDSGKLMHMVARSSHWQFTPDMRLTRRFTPEHGADAIDRTRTLLRELQAIKREE